MKPIEINIKVFEAMKKHLPVEHKGIEYERILDYILWYDDNGKLRQSVVLLQNRSSVRVLVDEVTVVEPKRL